MPTIFALSTAPGRAGIAVIRMSGPKAARATKQLIGTLPQPRRATLRTLKHPDNDEHLDQALTLWFPGPNSFTGEDLTEFHIHGGNAVIQGVLEALGSIEGLRLAEPGEFSKRAFANGKLDLTAVEGLADLIDAETQAQRRQALKQSQGALRDLYENWRKDILQALALTEAALDFSDEADVPETIANQARPLIEQTHNSISAHLNDEHRGEILREGFKVVIAGPPNVGKSSLLNTLAKRPAAIVSQEAGTTRDIIEVRLNLNGYPVIITDTAGIRHTESAIEQEGIKRTRDHAAGADLILWLEEASNKDREANLEKLELPPHKFPDPPQQMEDKKHRKQDHILTVLNKIDSLQKPRKPISRRFGSTQFQ